MAIALRPNRVERVVGFGGSQGLAGAKHPDSALLLQRSCAAPRSQRELVPLHDQVESVPRRKPESVPDSLGHDDAAGPVKAHCATHDAMVPWHVLFENGIGVGSAVTFAGSDRGEPRAKPRCGLVDPSVELGDVEPIDGQGPACVRTVQSIGTSKEAPTLRLWLYVHASDMLTRPRTSNASLSTPTTPRTWCFRGIPRDAQLGSCSVRTPRLGLAAARNSGQFSGQNAAQDRPPRRCKRSS